jgi:mono/diheme cytochrome c family protein
MRIGRGGSALLVLAALLGGVAVASWNLAGPGDGDSRSTVKEPPLSALAMEGKAAYDANCAECHGPSGAGTDKGPPLVHRVYNAGHHTDATFHVAVRAGVRQHHWRFGSMPPQPHVKSTQVDAIVRYVREVQAANGIPYEPPRM